MARVSDLCYTATGGTGDNNREKGRGPLGVSAGALPNHRIHRYRQAPPGGCACGSRFLKASFPDSNPAAVCAVGKELLIRLTPNACKPSPPCLQTLCRAAPLTGLVKQGFV